MPARTLGIGPGRAARGDGRLPAAHAPAGPRSRTRSAARLLRLADGDQRPQLHPRLRCDLGRLDEADTRRSYEDLPADREEAAKAGFGEYRTHLNFMDLVDGPSASATMPTGGSARGSRTPSIRTGSSRPASSESGPRPTAERSTAGGRPMSKRLEGKVALITGTGGGQGRAAAVRFARGRRAGRRLRPVRAGQPGNGRYRAGRRRRR